MREVFIHIGTTKTGSTAVQSALKLRRVELLEQGACYPLSPGKAAHFLVTHEANERVRSGRPLDAPPRTDGSQGAHLDTFRAAFAEEMHALPPHVDRVILSDERMSFQLATEDRIAALREFLAPYFDRFTILVYLRSQVAYLASRYSNLLRLGMVEDKEELWTPEQQARYYDYRGLLDRWAAVFGAEALRPRLYESAPGKPFDAVADFLEVCRVRLGVAQDDRFERRNPSISFAGQLLLERLISKDAARAEHFSHQEWLYLANAVRRALPGRGWLPTRDEARAFMAPLEAGNDSVRAEFFPDRARLFEEDYEALPATPMTLSGEEMFEAACTALMEAVPQGKGLLKRGAHRDDAIAAKGKVGRRIRRRKLREE